MSDDMPPFIIDDEDDLAAQVAARIAEEAEHQPQAEEPAPDEIPDDYIDECLESNELGDGALYRELNRNDYLYVKSKTWKTWLKWQGHHWDVDHMDENLRAVEKVAGLYLRRAASYDRPLELAREKKRNAEKRADDATDPGEKTAANLDVDRYTAEIKRLKSRQEKYLRRVDRLRSIRGARNCVEWSTIVDRPLAIHGRELDQRPWLLPVANGVVELRTGELKDGRPDDYLVKSITIAYPADYPHLDSYLHTGEHSPCPVWEAFLTDIQPDPEIRGFLHRLFGYGITGHSLEHFIAVFIGIGRNGKGTMFEIIQEIMGDLAWRLQSEFILEQKITRSSSAASPDILSLMGRRIVIASETGENRHISAERVKEITGGDTLNCRGLFDKEEVNFNPTHTLFLQTNHIPKGLTKDFALRQRLLLIDFPYSYVEDPAEEARKDPANAAYFKKIDKELGGRLRKELPGILAWLVRGAILWQREGLRPPDCLKANVDKLRLNDDHLEQFLLAMCLRPWDAGRIYQIEDCADVDGRKYSSLIPDNQGIPPGTEAEGTAWRYIGTGLEGGKGRTIMFKEFFGHFIKWYDENIKSVKETDKYAPTKKGIAEQLRKKGFVVEQRGGHLKIFGGVEVLA